MTCPTCGRGRGAQAKPDHVRHLTCFVCGKAFEQRGPGRTRVTCGAKECADQRHRFTKHDLTALDEVA